ncbi:glycoside/pentoside/hexuronide:cation symporter, GPH family [Ruminococcus sp. YE71]|uniref:MFS transporter n=1 Tax=unclassified Ruminococcus TaxID=2608920 RepID=UPI00087FD7FC|nr:MULTISPECIES: MFS transporter [unclassified Ruminococcus]SDA17605.1 glycoside/pentoside/hexuronide:cation symporter, GPH family [Ruminococcus sp. YE78]SFW27096.1 glycoside/pentoside/hexuronide:cation symporter, GPH family [Ruminococcus sp. YE71]
MKKITNKVLLQFAVGQLGWSMLSGIVSNWLVFFYMPEKTELDAGQKIFITQGSVLLGLTVIGIITAIGRLFDAVTDPYIASKSDRCRHKDGRRIPFMRAIAVPFAAVTVLIFMSPVGGTSKVNDLALLVTLLLFYLFMTIYCTPYNALLPELGKDPKDRINVSTYISVTFFFGSAISYLVPNIAGFFRSSLGYANSFRVTIGILAAVAAICMLVPVFTIRESDYVDTTPSETPAFKSLAKTFSNKEFRKFVYSDIFYWVALTMFQTGLSFYTVTLIGLKSDKVFILFATMTAMSLVFYLPVNILAKKLGKKKLVMGAFIFFSFVFLFTAFAGKLGMGKMANGLAIAVLASIPMAVLGILPQAIVADVAQADGIQTGESREGMFFAARTFAMKMGQALAMVLFTSIKGIGENGFGLRVTAAAAAVLCLIGGLILGLYKENKIIGILENNSKETSTKEAE